MWHSAFSKFRVWLLLLFMLAGAATYALIVAVAKDAPTLDQIDEEIIKYTWFVNIVGGAVIGSVIYFLSFAIVNWEERSRR